MILLRLSENLGSKNRYVFALNFNFDKSNINLKLGWMVGDGASANDVAVHQVCKELDPKERYLKPKEVRIL